MNYGVVSASLFLSSAILFSTRYLIAASLYSGITEWRTSMGRFGTALSKIDPELANLSKHALILAVTVFIIGMIEPILKSLLVKNK